MTPDEIEPGPKPSIDPDPCGSLPFVPRPMYALADFGDPWDYWSVHASQDRTKAFCHIYHISESGAASWVHQASEGEAVARGVMHSAAGIAKR